MKEFDINLKNQITNGYYKVFTRKGKPANILFWNFDANYPLCGKVEGVDKPMIWSKEGLIRPGSVTQYDLFLKEAIDKYQKEALLYSGLKEIPTEDDFYYSKNACEQYFAFLKGVDFEKKEQEKTSKIYAWLVRDSYDALYLCFDKPKKHVFHDALRSDVVTWLSLNYIYINKELFPEITQDNSPVKVELPIMKSENIEENN